MSSYEPTAIPADAPRGLRSWLATQLHKIASVLTLPTVQGIKFAILAAEPARLEDGDLVYADGVNWNPGAGAGLYERKSGAWVKL